jgi:hypothetical protein
MVRSTFDWSLWIIFVFDGLAHPQRIFFKFFKLVNISLLIIWIEFVQEWFNIFASSAGSAFLYDLH